MNWCLGGALTWISVALERKPPQKAQLDIGSISYETKQNKTGKRSEERRLEQYTTK